MVDAKNTAVFLSALNARSVHDTTQLYLALVEESIKEYFPDERWMSEDYANLRSVADITVDSAISESTWSEIIGMMVPFFCYMCKNPLVSTIGVSCNSRRVDLLLYEFRLSSLKEVVEYYCHWQDMNKHIPFFDINVISENEFNANCYKMIVTPKKSGVENGKTTRSDLGNEV